jgi:hypothetical protein
LHDRYPGKDVSVTDNYEVYSPDAAPEKGGVPGTSWQVVIEYSNKGQAKPPTIVEVSSTQHPSRESALTAAEKHAFAYNPPDPFSPQGRTVYRDGPDGYLVVIQGAMTTFHMSVRIVQLVGSA